jgi:dCTP deaminase
MSVLSAQSIRGAGVITPCVSKFKRNGVSGGLSSATYDVSIAETIWMWPGRFRLASTVERFHMPSNICGTVCDKSTWARRGLAVQNTFIDPGWSGFLTIELTLHSFRFMRIKAGTPIAQIKFEWLDYSTEIPYGGKYQNQEAGPVKPRNS